MRKKAGDNALQHLLVLLELEIVRLVHIRKAPLFRDNDLLAAGELVAGAAEGLHDDGRGGVFAPDGEDDLANVDAGDGAVGFAPCAAHARLQTTRCKLIVWMGSE